MILGARSAHVQPLGFQEQSIPFGRLRWASAPRLRASLSRDLGIRLAGRADDELVDADVRGHLQREEDGAGDVGGH